MNFNPTYPFILSFTSRPVRRTRRKRVELRKITFCILVLSGVVIMMYLFLVIDLTARTLSLSAKAKIIADKQTQLTSYATVQSGKYVSQPEYNSSLVKADKVNYLPLATPVFVSLP